MSESVSYADIEFQDGRLYSPRFSDIYFAKDGPAETDRVFLDPARIIERISRCSEFTIVEFGFGSGLNFFQTAQRFIDSKSKARLRYISFERYPLTNIARRHALKQWSRNWNTFEEFCQTSPPPIGGWHRRFFHDSLIELSIYQGSAEAGFHDFLSQDQHGVDAWFLDGFKPEFNESMWSPEILGALPSLTKPQGTVTSFSVAGELRRKLAEAGFAVERIDNAPFKRHTLLASIKTSTFTPHVVDNEVSVVGGGFAGCATANALAKKGICVNLYEKEQGVGTRTSSIPVAIQHGRLAVRAATEADYRAHAYAFASSLVRGYSSCTNVGALQFSGPNFSEERLQRISEFMQFEWCQLIDPAQVRELTGVDLGHTGAWFPRSNYLLGPELCRDLVDHPNINIVQEEISLSHQFDEPTVLAVGANILEFANDPPLESITLEGQVNLFQKPGDSVAGVPILIKNGYVVPTQSQICAGSTYEYTKWSNEKATQQNLNRAREGFPDLELETGSIFRSQRMVNSDRFPIIGKAKEMVWYNLGHGSSGTISALFGGEFIASQISGEVLPSTSDTLNLLSPLRFRERQKRRPNPFSKKKS